MIAHDNISINRQPLFSYTIYQTVNNNIFVNSSRKHIKPIHRSSRDKIHAFGISEFIFSTHFIDLFTLSIQILFHWHKSRHHFGLAGRPAPEEGIALA
jgi:hypothetical protein